MPEFLHLRSGQKSEEGCHAGIVALFMPFEHPVGGATDNAVLGGLHPSFHRQRGHIPGKIFDRFFEFGDAADGIDIDCGILGDEFRLGSLVLLAAIEKAFVVHPLLEPGDVIDHLVIVDGQFAIQALVSVGFGGKGQVVNGAVVFDLGPGLPGGDHAAGHTGGHDGFKDLTQLVPCYRIFFGEDRQSGLLEQVDIVVHYGCGGIKRHGHQIALGIHVVGEHRLHIVLPVYIVAKILHQLVNRVDHSGHHHGLGAHFKRLQHVGMFFGPNGGNAGVDRFIIVALIGLDDHVFVLGGIEFLHHGFNRLAPGAAHGMPPMDFNGFGHCLGNRKNDNQYRRCKQ